MAAILDGGKLTLSGFVGDSYLGDGFTSTDVVLALSQVEDTDDLTVYINSPGGLATEGAAIHALLSRRKGRTDVVVDGAAVSAASLIAMAGETVTMSAGAIMMIHDPAGRTEGDSATHTKAIGFLEALATSYSRIYAAKSGKTPEECRQIMKAETWLKPDEAVAQGFADGTTENAAQMVAAFDYRVYAHAPRELTALSRQKNWSLSEADKRAVMSAAATRQPEEQSMTDKERADQLAAENATLKTQLEAAETAKASATAEAGKNASATAAAIVELCAKSGVPTMAAALIREGLTIEAATARADTAKDVRMAVDLARKSCPTIEATMADTMITAGLSMDQVRAQLFEKMTAAQSPEINASHQAGSGNDDPATMAALVVAHVRPQTKRSA